MKRSIALPNSNLKPVMNQSSPTAKNSEKRWRVVRINIKSRKMWHMELNDEYYTLAESKKEAMEIMEKLK